MRFGKYEFCLLVILFSLSLFLAPNYPNLVIQVQKSTDDTGDRWDGLLPEWKTPSVMMLRVRDEETTIRNTPMLQNQEQSQAVSMLAASEGDMQWNRTYGGLYSLTYAVIKTTDDSYVIGGHKGNSMLLVKINSSGELQWSQTYGGYYSGSKDVAYAVIETADGGYALAGQSQTFGTGDFNFCLVKADGNGVLQWNQTYGGQLTDCALAVIETTDGGFALAGYTFVPEEIGLVDFWLVKTDATGNMQWNQTYGNRMEDIAYAIIETVDGGFIIAGSTQADIMSNFDHDGWLVKTDATGNMQWNQTYGSTESERFYALIETTDGGFALVGYTKSYGAGGGDFWLVKTDATGEVKWNQTYGDTDWEVANAVIETTDGGFALTGRTRSYGAGNADFWLVKTDRIGSIQWSRTYGGPAEEIAHSVIQTDDGGFILTGVSFSNGPNQDWTVKTAPTPPTIDLISPQNATYAIQTIPVYALNTTPVDTACWRYWNGSWYGNYTLTWNDTSSQWEAEGLIWTDGSYEIQVYFTDSIGREVLASQWFTVDTTLPPMQEFRSMGVKVWVLLAIVGLTRLIYRIRVHKTSQ